MWFRRKLNNDKSRERQTVSASARAWWTTCKRKRNFCRKLKLFKTRSRLLHATQGIRTLLVGTLLRRSLILIDLLLRALRILMRYRPTRRRLQILIFLSVRSRVATCAKVNPQSWATVWIRKKASSQQPQWKRSLSKQAQFCRTWQTRTTPPTTTRTQQIPRAAASLKSPCWKGRARADKLACSHQVQRKPRHGAKRQRREALKLKRKISGISRRTDPTLKSTTTSRCTLETR